MTSRRFALLLFLLLTLSAGISSAQSSDVVIQLAASTLSSDIIQSSIDAFGAAHPGIQVQLVNYDGFGSPVQYNDDAEAYQDDLAEYFRMADVLLVDETITAEATRAGYLLNLMPLTSSDPDYSAANFRGDLANAFSWDFGQWAIPLSVDATVLTYLPEAFDAAGLTYPDASWTLDDLLFAARQLAQFDSSGSMTLPGLWIQGGANGTLIQSLVMSLYGQSIADDMVSPSVPDYSDPALAALLDTWATYEEEGYTSYPSDFDTNLVPMRIGSGFGGRVAFVTTGGGDDAPPGLQQVEESNEIDVLLPGGHAGLSVNGYAISSGTSNPQAAWELVKFLIQQPNVIQLSGATNSALVNAPTQDSIGGNGRARIFGFGGLSDEMLEAAVAGGLMPADMRFARGITTALDTMSSDSVDARTALDEAAVAFNERLAVADARAATPIAVNPPEVVQELAPGEVELTFGVVAGGRFAFGGDDVWETLGNEFAALDAEVGRVNVELPSLGSDNSTENFDCYYSGTNLVPSLDLDTVLSLDPLIFSDPAIDPNDYIPGVFEQVQLNGQTWALPIQISPLVLTINTALFNEAGVPIPTDGWSVSEFEDALRQLRNVVDTDEAPLQFNDINSTALMNLIAVYGGLPFNMRTDPATVNFTDSATMAAIQQVLDLVKDGYISYASAIDTSGGNISINIRPQGDTAISAGQGVLNFGGGRAGFGGGPGGGNAGAGNAAAAINLTVPFPTGTSRNAVAFDLGALYLSSTSQHPEACYRFMSYIASAADTLDSMPARMSLINSDRLRSAQGDTTADFYNTMATIMSQPGVILLPADVSISSLNMTNWLLDVFDRYIADEVVDLATELQIAQQKTQDYMACVANLEEPVRSQTGAEAFQQYFQDVQACQMAADA